MKKSTRFGFLIFFFVQFSFGSFSQSVIPHPVPEEFISDQYVVSVNGTPVQVFCAGLNVYFASFDFTGTADVKVTAATIQGEKTSKGKYTGQILFKYGQPLEGKDFWAGNAQVKPVSASIKTLTNGAIATFSLTEPGQYSVERPGTSNHQDQVLFLFANRPETERLKAGDANVIYLQKGIHQRNIDLESGQTLYLEPGAVLFGAVNVWNANNVRILGRGTVVYYGPQSETTWYPAELNNIKNWHPLTTHNTLGLTVSGITFVCRSRIWTIRMHSTFDAVFDNIKILNVNPADVNGDGFDWQGGGRTTIKNSLVRSADDCFAFFVYNPAEEVPDGVTPNAEAVTKSNEVKDILIENCVLWPTRANIYRAGGDGMALRTDNIVMKNCDILHISRWEMLAPRAFICSVNSGVKVKAINKNYLFQDIRVEEPIAFTGIIYEEAVFQNIVFKDITIHGSAVPSMAKCTIEGLTFENVKANGKLILNKENVPFSANSNEIKNLNFK